MFPEVISVVTVEEYNRVVPQIQPVESVEQQTDLGIHKADGRKNQGKLNCSERNCASLWRRPLVKSIDHFLLSPLCPALVDVVAALTSITFGNSIAEENDSKQPNIVWFVVDDMSANFSCYGETAIETPNVDRLAREGTLFRRAFVTAPVCSPSRSALITGMYQTSIGVHRHRSGQGDWKITCRVGSSPFP